jgi:hypothetical protein
MSLESADIKRLLCNSKIIFPSEKIELVRVSVQERSQQTTVKPKKRRHKIPRDVKEKGVN